MKALLFSILLTLSLDGFCQTTKIEAEDYISNASFKSMGREPAFVGTVVGILSGGYLAYDVTIPKAGMYTLTASVNSLNPSPLFQIRDNSGVILATTPIPKAANPRTYNTIILQIKLPAGKQRLLVYCAGDTFNLDYWTFTKQ